MSGWRGNFEFVRPGATQSVAIGGASAATTNAFGESTRMVRVVSTTDAFITFAKTPVATTAHMFLPANVPEYFLVDPGQKAALIQSTASGDAYITEVSK